MLKRAFDIAAAVVALVLMSPVLLLAALATKLDSRGPVLFKQHRIGLNGEPFTIYKFRSMTHDPGRRHKNISPAGDSRVTRVGALLRGTFIDELPQLLNVIRGDMSLVGPRPETPEHVALYSDEQREVLRVKPGMAGPSALAFWNEAEILAKHEDPHDYYLNHMMHERIQLDLGYAEESSFGYDLKLLAKTLRVILVRA